MSCATTTSARANAASVAAASPPPSRRRGCRRRGRAWRRRTRRPGRRSRPAAARTRRRSAPARRGPSSDRRRSRTPPPAPGRARVAGQHGLVSADNVGIHAMSPRAPRRSAPRAPSDAAARRTRRSRRSPRARTGSATRAVQHPGQLHVVDEPTLSADEAARPPCGAPTRTSCLALGVEHRDVHRLARAALDPHALGHLLEPHRRRRARCRTRRTRSRRDRWRGRPGDGVVLKAVAPSGGTSPSRTRRMTIRSAISDLGRACVVKSLISASSTVCTTPSPIDAALPLIVALVLIAPPPSSM